MPIVFDNIIFNLQRMGGVSRFWSKIIQPYAGDCDSLFIERVGCENNNYRRDMTITLAARDHRLPTKIARYLNFRRRFFDDVFVFHSSYFRINEALGCKNVTTVHDLIYEKFCSGVGSVLHLHQKAVALRKSDCIVCVSEHTRLDLYEHYPFCRDKRVVVIPNGVEGFYPSAFNSQFFERVCIENPNLYFLYVGHRGGCKGFDLVHEAIDILGGELNCVVVGEPFSQKELTRISERGHEKKLLNIGRVSDTDLNDLYSHARFFFFPSLYEGFGIPPIEAMLAGCPVLASNRSSVPEVVGNSGILFDPSDIATLRAGLSRILQSDVREQLIATGLKHAARFGWRPVVDAYAGLYARLLGAEAEI